MDIRNSVQQYTLPNGLRVALVPGQTETALIALSIGHGAANERRGEEGIAHFVEHVLITGGSERHSPNAIEGIISGWDMWNASTGEISTAMWTDTLPEDIPEALQLFASCAYAPSMPAEIIERERRSILNEMFEKRGVLTFSHGLLFNRALFSDTIHALDCFGRTEVIESATREKLLQFHARGFSPNNSRLRIIGKLPQDIESIVERTCSGFAHGAAEPLEYPRAPRLTQQLRFHVAAPDLASSAEGARACIYLGFIAAPAPEPGCAALTLVTEILGGHMYSRLGSLRHSKGLTYGAQAGYSGLENRGSLVVKAMVPAAETEQALQGIFEEFERLRTEEVPEHELALAKRRFRISIARQLQGNNALNYELSILNDFGLTHAELMEEIYTQTPQDLQRAAREFLPAHDGNYVLMIRDPELD